MLTPEQVAYEKNFRHYSLPENYAELSTDARRMARLRVVCRRRTPEDEVAAFDLFTKFYLLHPDAYFFDDFSDFSDCHYEWIWARASEQFVLILAHRGLGKSTICTRVMTLMDLCTKPGSKTLMVLSADHRVEEHFDAIMQQLDQNPLILHDFGRLRPQKNEGIWNRHFLRLTNRAMLKGGGITSDSLRGMRPHRIIVDDAEYDPKEGTNMDRMTADMEKVLFKILMPMLRGKSQLFWIGTPTHMRSLIWQMYAGEDPRFDTRHWFKRLYGAFKDDGTPQWSSEYDEAYLLRKKEQLGSAWQQEMMCVPGTDEFHPLTVDPVLNEYSWDADEELTRVSNSHHPLESTHIVKYTLCKRQPDNQIVKIPQEVRASELFSKMTRFITVDYAPTVKPGSDNSVVNVLGVDQHNQLWELDMWSGKCRSHELIDTVFAMSAKWQCRIVGVEAVSIQEELFHRVRDRAEDIRSRGMFAPQVLALKWGQMDKGSRIGNLEWRFRQGLVKLPRPRRYEKLPGKSGVMPFNNLYNQIEGFTLSLAGLAHDDELDTLSMYYKVTPGAAAHPGGAEVVTLEDRVARGDLHYAPGIPIGTMMPLEKMPPKVLEGLLRRHYQGVHQQAVERSSDDDYEPSWQNSSL